MVADRTREQICEDARAEKRGYLRGRFGWTDEQITAYFAGRGGSWGWLPPHWVYWERGIRIV